jgi:hypothetical protein
MRRAAAIHNSIVEKRGHYQGQLELQNHRGTSAQKQIENLHYPGRRRQTWEDENTTAAVGSRRLMADVHSMMWPRKFDYGSSRYPYLSHSTRNVGEFGCHDQTSMGDEGCIRLRDNARERLGLGDCKSIDEQGREINEAHLIVPVVNSVRDGGRG